MPHFLEVPVPYKAAVIWPRCRRVERAYFVTRVIVEIPEIAASEAPVAMQATLPDGTSIAYRRDRSGNLLRALALEINGRHVPVTLDNAQATLDAWVAAPKPRRRLVKWPFDLRRDSSSGPVYPEGTPVRELNETTRETQIIRYRNLFQNEAAVIDGQLYLPSRGPAWVITCGLALGDIPYLCVEAELNHDTMMTYPGWIFGFGHHSAAAEAMAGKEWPRRQGNGPFGPDQGSIHLCDTSPAEVDFPGQVVRAARAVMALTAHSLGDMPIDAVRLYGDLKATIEAGISRGDAREALMTVCELHAGWQVWRETLGETHGIDPVAPLLDALAGPVPDERVDPAPEIWHKP